MLSHVEKNAVNAVSSYCREMLLMTKLFILRGLLDVVYYSEQDKIFLEFSCCSDNCSDRTRVLNGENVVVAYYAS